MNGVNRSLGPGDINLTDSIYDFFRSFTVFITNKDVKERDITGDEDKIKRIPSDINCIQKGNTRNKRAGIVTSLVPRDQARDSRRTDTVYESEEEEESKANGLDCISETSWQINPNDLVERFELLILEKMQYKMIFKKKF